MAVYAIGDIHGANTTLGHLLERLEAQGPIDRLWFVGDLVNRGPDSAGVLRRVRALGERAITVLGNHDLALLGLANDRKTQTRANASLQDLLQARDRDVLLDWLRHRPVMHHDADLNWTMVHAGLEPSWDLEEARALADELEEALRGPDHDRFLARLFGNTPAHWKAGLSGAPRLRFLANAFTRIRFVDETAGLDMAYKKTIADAPAELMPWFVYPGRASRHTRLVFGHWSALDAVAWPEHNVWGIDTGAAWRGALTAMRLDTAEPEFISVPAAED